MPSGCTAGEERAIRAVGERFSYLWRQMDARELAGMFTADGDMRHPDGTIERGARVLSPEPARAFHGNANTAARCTAVQLNDIRCLAGGIAIADGKWELRFDDSPTAPAPLGRGPAQARRHSGWCTLVLVRGDSLGDPGVALHGQSARR